MFTSSHLTILLQILHICQPLVQPRKCCSQLLSLDTSDKTYPQCVPAESLSLDSAVNTNIPSRLPNCKAEYEVHSLGPENTQEMSSYSWMGEDGSLVTTKYGEEFRIADFCVDQDVKTQEQVAVTCDACKEKVCPGICFL